jgi:hypothetical protein
VATPIPYTQVLAKVELRAKTRQRFLGPEDQAGRRGFFFGFPDDASYFAVVRWLAHIGSTPIGRLNIGAWAAIFVYSGVLLLISVPFVLILGDGLLALGAWLVWRPSVQRALRWMRRKARKQ